MGRPRNGQSEKELEYFQQISVDVQEILDEEAAGNEEAFILWLHDAYLDGFGGEILSNFDEFKNSPLAMDMVADWQNDCSTMADRVELLDHIFGFYTAEDFDEQEHFDEEGNPIICYGEPGDKHFDKDGKPIAPYILSLEREQK